MAQGVYKSYITANACHYQYICAFGHWPQSGFNPLNRNRARYSGLFSGCMIPYCGTLERMYEQISGGIMIPCSHLFSRVRALFSFSFTYYILSHRIMGMYSAR
jgi:hypothetical protein